jgi:hypothetical protein
MTFLTTIGALPRIMKRKDGGMCSAIKMQGDHLNYSRVIMLPVALFGKLKKAEAVRTTACISTFHGSKRTLKIRKTI